MSASANFSISNMKLTFAARPSALARWQTRWVIQQLQVKWPDLQCQEVAILTQGDRILDRPLPEIGGKGLFTQELEAELLNGHVQAAVHSLKDLPVGDSPNLTIGAVPARADARDALVSSRGYRLMELPEGARVGTSSLRRSAQLLSVRPDLRVEPLRGNVDTRLRKALDGQYDAILLAGAGLARLGLENQVSEWLPYEVMLPAPGQGALAVQCRSSDAETLRLLAVIEDPPTRAATVAERAFLSDLGGGCALPVAAYAAVQSGGVRPLISMTGLVASLDGTRTIRVHGTGDDPRSLGAKLAQEALRQGAHEILSLAA
jgi:hydroxymethylbilane synthase